MNCLVIIDMQKGFVNEYTEHLKDKIKEFIELNRHKFDYIVATRYINSTNTACYKFEGWNGCMSGSGEEELIDELDTKYIDYIFDKDRYSCYNSEFKQYLKEKDINKLYYVGVNTGCCVLNSAFDSYNSLVDSYIVEDLCGSTSGEKSHKCAIQILKECITTQRVIQSSEL